MATAMAAVTLTLVLAAGLAGAIGASPVAAIVLAFCPLVLALWAFHRAGDGTFGLANAITSIRLGLAAVLAAPMLQQLRVDPSWTVVLTAILVLALDGLDGWIARRRGEVSRFGARFDMEADAVLLLALALLVLASGRAGAWVLLAPALRPLFVLAGRFSPWLAAPLPPSTRRKLCCVIPLLALTAALAPPVGAPLAAALVGSAVLVLAWSFAVDLWWLAARRGEGRSH